MGKQTEKCQVSMGRWDVSITISSAQIDFCDDMEIFVNGYPSISDRFDGTMMMNYWIWGYQDTLFRRAHLPRGSWWQFFLIAGTRTANHGQFYLMQMIK